MAKSKKRRQTRQKPLENDFRFARPEIKDYSDPRNLEKMTRELFAEAVETIKPLRAKRPDFCAALDLDPVRRKRRQAATRKTMDFVAKMVAEVCPDRPGAFYIPEEWAKINSVPVSSYELIENRASMTLAAAIWMLDHIRENGKCTQAVKLLPMDDEIFDTADVPDICDLSCDIEILWSMTYVIQQRNAGCVALRPKGQAHSGGIPRYWTDAYTAAGTQHQEVDSRKCFESLMALIDRDAVQKAVSHFEEKLWEWVKRYYSCRSISAGKEAEWTERYCAFGDKAEQGAVCICQKAAEKKRRASSNGFPIVPMAEMSPPPFDPLNVSKQQMDLELMRFMEDIAAESEELSELRSAIDDEIHLLLYGAYEYGNTPLPCLEEEIGATEAEIIKGFEIDDPYELCFALLYLIDTGSDLPWLYYPGTCIMKSAAARLPWYFDDYDEDEDQFWNDWDEDAGETESVFAPRTSKSRQPPELLDWYRLNYTLHLPGERVKEQSNLAQIVYRLTGTILPRDTHRYDSAVDTFARYGITGKKTLVPLLHCLSLLGEGRHRLQSWSMYDIPLLPDESVAEETETAQPTDASPGAGQEIIKTLREENDQLKKSLHEARHEAREAKRKLESQSQVWERERQELNDFRELFFHLEEEDEAAEDAPSKIPFPYETKKRTVVFGGHDSWAKAIRPMLPEVRFVARGAVPNPDLIRHADVVWIQVNALAHKHYYKIMDVARTYHIPVRYFGYASAEKCAEQLAVEDMN